MRFILLCLLLFPWLSLGQNKATDVVGKVASISGDVKLQRGELERQLEVNDPIQATDILTAGETGSAKLLLIDSTILDLGPKSSINIQRMLGTDEKRNALIDVKLGKVRASIIKKVDSQGSFKIRTKVTAFSVRGTDFSVQSDENSEVTVFEGKVQATQNKSGNAVMVDGGFKLEITDSKMGKLTKLSAADLKESFLQAHVIDNTFNRLVLVRSTPQRSTGRLTLKSVSKLTKIPKFSLPLANFHPPGVVLPSALLLNGNLINYYPVDVKVKYSP